MLEDVPVRVSITLHIHSTYDLRVAIDSCAIMLNCARGRLQNVQGASRDPRWAPTILFDHPSYNKFLKIYTFRHQTLG